MLINLKDLHPNSQRDFRIDPIDDERVESLRQSIVEHTFWPGVICRRVNGHVEIIAGHHRVAAAKKANVKEADLGILNEVDDAEAIKIYARENATQRGNNGTSLTGSVAAAVRLIAKAILTDNPTPLNLRELTKHRWEVICGVFAKSGVGEDNVTALLADVPGINKSSVQQQLANLKSSGEYARIIKEIKDELADEETARAAEEAKRAEASKKAAEEAKRKAEKERAEAEARRKAAEKESERKKAEEERRAAERRAAEAEARRKKAEDDAARAEAAKKAAEEAKQKAAADLRVAEEDARFDYVGVSKHLKTPIHVVLFRKLAVDKNILGWLHRDKQAALAKLLVEKANSNDDRLTGDFIRDNFIPLAKSLVGKSPPPKDLPDIGRFCVAMARSLEDIPNSLLEEKLKMLIKNKSSLAQYPVEKKSLVTSLREVVKRFTTILNQLEN